MVLAVEAAERSTEMKERWVVLVVVMVVLVFAFSDVMVNGGICFVM